jgi:hypothetical protein
MLEEAMPWFGGSVRSQRLEFVLRVTHLCPLAPWFQSTTLTSEVLGEGVLGGSFLVIKAVGWCTQWVRSRRWRRSTSKS